MVKDLLGMTFGKLTVLEYEGRNENNQVLWECQCSCEDKKIVIIPASNLLGGNSKSCGCLMSESKQLNKKSNEYELSREFGIGYTFKGEEFYFDLEDYDLIKEYRWHISNGYVLASEKKRRKPIIMHQLIIGTKEDYVIDHINRKKNDNRKSNLRIATSRENAMNRTISKQNSTGVSGVTLSYDKKRWISTISSKYLGSYHTFFDAVVARLFAEMEKYGEFAPQKHLFEQYGINFKGG